MDSKGKKGPFYPGMVNTSLILYGSKAPLNFKTFGLFMIILEKIPQFYHQIIGQ